jgi:hypothetical protein
MMPPMDQRSLRVAVRTNKLDEIICVLGIGLPHLGDRIPVTFASHLIQTSIIVDIQENHRIGSSIIYGDNSLLMAALALTAASISMGAACSVYTLGPYGGETQTVPNSSPEIKQSKM